jgi:hypothetical protein
MPWLGGTYYASGIANTDLMNEFWGKCLSKLDQQEFSLQSEESKKCAIQCVQRVLGSFDEESAIKIIRYKNWNCKKR